MTFKISYFENSLSNDHLPQTHTCFNEILLFNYDSKEILEEKLKQAMLYSEGFGIR